MVNKLFKILKDNWKDYQDYIEFGDDVYPDEEPDGQTLGDKWDRFKQIVHTIIGKLKPAKEIITKVYSPEEERMDEALRQMLIDMEKVALRS
jgi:hypothetical protein